MITAQHGPQPADFADVRATNLAVVLRLPAIFVFENNRYGEGTGHDYAVGSKDIAGRARGFGLPSMKVDGTDFFAVHEAARDAVERARHGGGPSAIEVEMERFYGHHSGDAQLYRVKGGNTKDVADLAGKLKTKSGSVETVGDLLIITDSGADVFWLPRDDRVGLDSIYVRDATTLVPDGLVFCSMGKPLRASEPDVQRASLAASGVQIAGHIEPPGRLEGGDVVWLDATTAAIGRGYRTNDEGIAQFARLAGPDVTCIPVPLPH